MLYPYVVFAACMIAGEWWTRRPNVLPWRQRWLFVTPDMHRIHHFSRREETDSNYGNLFSGWDRLFCCYVDEPQGGQTGFDLGLSDYREPQRLSLWGLLKGPFVRAPQIRITAVHADAKTFPGDLF